MLNAQFFTVYIFNTHSLSDSSPREKFAARGVFPFRRRALSSSRHRFGTGIAAINSENHGLVNFAIEARCLFLISFLFISLLFLCSPPTTQSTIHCDFLHSLLSVCTFLSTLSIRFQSDLSSATTLSKFCTPAASAESERALLSVIKCLNVEQTNYFHRAISFLFMPNFNYLAYNSSISYEA